MKRFGYCVVGLFLIQSLVPVHTLAQRHTDPFPVAALGDRQEIPQVAFNPATNEYLAVWEDQRNGVDADIYGQFFNADGSLKGDNFEICTTTGHQYWPRLAFDPSNSRYLIVFEDWRNPDNGDIRGIFVNTDGTFYDPPGFDVADHTFGICTHEANIYTCSVAFNLEFMNYLVVWGDCRNDPTNWTGADVYGQLVAADGTLLPPPTPADPTENFPIANDPEYEESVADVTWMPATLEFFVVFGTSTGYVLGQRVDGAGSLINSEGAVAKVISWGSAIQISEYFINGTDCLQARVKGNNEFWTMHDNAWIECEVIWKGNHPTLGYTDNDVWGQRIRFMLDGQVFKAKYMDVNGDTTLLPSNHAISLQPGNCNPPEIDYSVQDDEFLVGWGDPRNSADPTDFLNLQWDLYCQPLDINDQKEMIWKDITRTSVVANTVNVPLAMTSNLERSLMGIAHNPDVNEFLIVFEYEDLTALNSLDIYGMLVSGLPSSVAPDVSSLPTVCELSQNYPNPFNPVTEIAFTLTSDQTVNLAVFDMMGRHVKTLVQGKRAAGPQTVFWDGTDAYGEQVASGVYLYKIEAKQFNETKRMILIR